MFEKQYETKEVVSFDGLYLKINITDKRLIQLDHITYIVWAKTKSPHGSEPTGYSNCTSMPGPYDTSKNGWIQKVTIMMFLFIRIYLSESSLVRDSNDKDATVDESNNR